MNRAHRSNTTAAALIAAAALLGCSDRLDATGSVRGPIVYGADNRQEYFQVSAPEMRARMEASLVALVPSANLEPGRQKLRADVASWAELDGLCPEEPFGEQPAAAFCTGVLLDWDLVLTAGHCTRAFAVEDLNVVFDYHYMAPGQLAVGDGDIVQVAEIVSEALDSGAAEERLDYAWLRLEQPVAPPRQPSPIRARAGALKLDDSVVSIGTAGGVAMKFDAGGQVRDLREAQSDYFVSDSDTSHGQSGGGAFDAELSLIGILARGGNDWVETDQGCRATALQPDPLAAAEQFTYAHRAVEALCSADPTASSLCRAECGAPCQALPSTPTLHAAGGCAFNGRPARGAPLLGVLLLLLVARRRVSTENWPAGRKLWAASSDRTLQFF